MALYDYIKYRTSLDMIENTRGENIFPRVPLGEKYSTGTVDGLRQVVGIESRSEQEHFLNRMVVIGHYIQFIATYVERASGRLHDSALSKNMSMLFCSNTIYQSTVVKYNVHCGGKSWVFSTSWCPKRILHRCCLHRWMENCLLHCSPWVKVSWCHSST